MKRGDGTTSLNEAMQSSSYFARDERARPSLEVLRVASVACVKLGGTLCQVAEVSLGPDAVEFEALKSRPVCRDLPALARRIVTATKDQVYPVIYQRKQWQRVRFVDMSLLRFGRDGGSGLEGIMFAAIAEMNAQGMF